MAAVRGRHGLWTHVADDCESLIITSDSKFETPVLGAPRGHRQSMRPYGFHACQLCSSGSSNLVTGKTWALREGFHNWLVMPAVGK